MFSFEVPPIYPHDAPKVKCKTKVDIVFLNFIHMLLLFTHVIKLVIYPFESNLQVYHPNIDLEGNVCLNVLREDWKPVLNINTIIYGLYHLFTVILDHFIFFSFLPVHFSSSETLFLHRNQIMRIPLIMMLLNC